MRYSAKITDEENFIYYTGNQYRDMRWQARRETGETRMNGGTPNPSTE
jgi:hypothetical protein